ncbi:uncharacterized protein EV420DRAFT_1752030 [Desarmillaria tabescens]|uniref:Uncharacterized protein n=1 Tax=Armillaria tabescens TaxID=1929756 RepID=A0AA39MRL9_ARMTA|nr:uncharacterized protein EV420DRAFT_1752030 [Desarmillaria tabescens]KAK0443703.1 hypothetical protein EV420DRAFT_1752030 [Desarmillaria tabescens]
MDVLQHPSWVYASVLLPPPSTFTHSLRHGSPHEHTMVPTASWQCDHFLLQLVLELVIDSECSPLDLIILRGTSRKSRAIRERNGPHCWKRVWENLLRLGEYSRGVPVNENFVVLMRGPNPLLLEMDIGDAVLETARKYSINPRLVIVASDVHYWTTIEEDVMSAPGILVQLSDREYCSKEEAKYLRKRREHFAFATEEGSLQLVYNAVDSLDDEEKLRGKRIRISEVVKESDFVELCGDQFIL